MVRELMPTRSAADTAKLALEDEALKLRIKGMPYRDIAKATNASHEGARDRVRRAMERLKASVMEKAEECRALELERLDVALQKHMDVIENPDSKYSDVCYATDRMLSIQKRRADMMGLDTVDKPLSGFVETDRDKLIALLRERITKINSGETVSEN